MKKNINKILISVFALLAIFSIAGVVNAAGGVYVTPASLTKTVGNSFDVSVGVQATASKVYAVEGTIVFNKLTCKSITVADGVTVQTAPTCAKPYFLLGIPNGTIIGKALLTASVTADSAGTASIGFTGVDIIGEGVSLGSDSVGGVYTINSAVLVKKVEITEPAQNTTSVATIEKVVEPTTETLEEVAEIQTESSSQTAAAAGASPENKGGNSWIWIILGIIVVAIGYGVSKYKKTK